MSHDISSLSTKWHSSIFRFLGITFFCEYARDSISAYLTNDFTCYVIDFGVLEQENLQDFLRFDQCILIGSISPWKNRELIYWMDYFLEQNLQKSETIVYLGAFGIKAFLQYLPKKYISSISIIPIIENPFQLKPADFAFFNQLLQRS